MEKIHLMWDQSINVKKRWAKGDILMWNLDNAIFNNQEELEKALNKKNIKITGRLRDRIMVQVPNLKQTRVFKFKKINI